MNVCAPTWAPPLQRQRWKLRSLFSQHARYLLEKTNARNMKTWSGNGWMPRWAQASYRLQLEGTTESYDIEHMCLPLPAASERVTGKQTAHFVSDGCEMFKFLCNKTNIETTSLESWSLHVHGIVLKESFDGEEPANSLFSCLLRWQELLIEGHV